MTFNSLKNKAFKFIPLVIIIFFIIFTYNEFLTNEFTPGGDGGRIFPFIAMLEGVEEKFPLWNPWTYHGYPLLYEIQEFYFENIFLDHKSEYFNLKLNLYLYVFFSLTIYFCYYVNYELIFKSKLIAIVASLFLIISYNYQMFFFHGRLVTVKWIFLSGLSGWLYIKYFYSTKFNTKIIYYALSSLLIALSFLHSFQYFFFNCFNFILLFFYLNIQNEKIQNIFFDLIFVLKKFLFFISLGLIFSLPVLFYRLEGLFLSEMSSGIVSYGFNSSNPFNSNYPEILNCLWPFFFLILIFHETKYKKLLLICIPIFIISYIIPILVNEYNFFNGLWKNTPLLSLIRSGDKFVFLRLLSSVIFMSIYYSYLLNINNFQTHKLDKKDKIFLLIFLLGMILAMLFCNNFYEKFIYVSIIFSLIPLIPKYKFLFMRNKFFLNNKYFIILPLLLSFFISSYNIDKSPKGRLHISYNDLRDGKLIQKKNEKRDYYSWYKFKHKSDNLILTSWHPPFSLYFNSEYKKLLKEIYHDEKDYQRIHWWYWKNINKKQKNKALANLIGINTKKYYQFKFFKNWVVEPDNNFKTLNEINHFNKIIVNKNPIFLKGKNFSNELRYDQVKILKKSSHKFELKVNSSKNQILFIPESFDKYWTLEINGSKRELLKGFLVFRAVPLGPGEHIIKMRYKYNPIYYLSIISIILLIVFYILRKKILSSNFL